MAQCPSDGLWDNTLAGQYSTKRCFHPTNLTYFRYCNNGTEPPTWDPPGGTCTCPAIVNLDGVSIWGEVPMRTTAKEDCGPGFVGQRYRQCLDGGVWSPLSLTGECRPTCPTTIIDGLEFGSVAENEASSVPCIFPQNATAYRICGPNRTFGNLISNCICPATQDDIGSWRSAPALYREISQCPTTFVGNRARTCGVLGDWGEISNADCVPHCTAETHRGWSWRETEHGMTQTHECSSSSGTPRGVSRLCRSNGRSNPATWEDYVHTTCTCVSNDDDVGSWNSTVGRYSTTSSCPQHFRGLRSRQCGETGIWGDIVTTGCIPQCPPSNAEGYWWNYTDVGQASSYSCSAESAYPRNTIYRNCGGRGSGQVGEWGSVDTNCCKLFESLTQDFIPFVTFQCITSI
ncbi:hypothetical protein BC829DRAFT_154144 [Chytridium lagenaria]|nr:hypothetical protein BC829DRAFT_154144 [Chytridium lagenaria]